MNRSLLTITKRGKLFLSSFLANWRRPNTLFYIGLAVWIIVICIYFGSGDQFIVNVHDEMDSPELASYYLRTTYAGDFPWDAFLGGAWTPMQMPSTGSLVFYAVFGMVLGYKINAAFVLLLSYWGLWICAKELGVKSWISAISAFAYSSLPFYSVFGLSVMGVPIAIWALIRLLRSNLTWKPLACILLYGLFSSLAQVGFAVVFIYIAACAISIARHERIQSFRVFIGVLILIGIYVTVSSSLISQLFGIGETAVSHRTEFDVGGDDFNWKSVWEFLKNGQYHAVSNHRYILYLTLAVDIPLYLCVKQDDANQKKLIISLGLVISATCIAIFHIFWTSSLAIPIKNALPAFLRSFQIDRFYWLYPMIFYLDFALASELLIENTFDGFKRILAGIMIVVIAILTLTTSWKGNVFVRTVQTSISSETGEYGITWNEVFEPELFNEIKEDLESLSGEQKDYRIMSLGLYPSIPLINGFYTLDGYSTDYSIDYKHEFQDIIEGELARDPELKTYYADWGNRVYLFSHELGRNFFVSKTSSTKIKDLRIDIEQAQKMGAEYIFSTVEIGNSKDLGLTLLNRYVTDTSIYEIFVYRINN